MTAHDDLPDGSNFFAVLVTTRTRQEVAGAFADEGWRVRPASRTSYHIRSAWAELVLDGASPFLLHGPMAAVLSNAPQVVQFCRRMGIGCTAECYGEDGDLLKVFTTAD